MNIDRRQIEKQDPLVSGTTPSTAVVNVGYDSEGVSSRGNRNYARNPMDGNNGRYNPGNQMAFEIPEVRR